MPTAALALVCGLATGCSGFPFGGAPDPGGRENARFGRPANGKSFGFSDSAFAAPRAFNPARLTARETARAARAAGATSQRLVLDWRLAEPSPGAWNENYVAKLERVAAAFPRRPLIVLAFAPTWANPRSASFCPEDAGCLFPPSASSLPAWEAFVRRAARTFPRADFEIWNEPNLRGFWQPAVDPPAYLRLVRAAWKGIQRERAAGHSRARVAVGALAQVPDAGDASRTPWNFLEELFDDGLRGNYDALSWHAYPYQSDGSVKSLSGGSAFARDWERMREVVARHDPEARFWITETGVTTTGGAAVSEAEQADRVGAVTRKLLDMPDVAAVYVHTLFEWARHSPESRELGFGVIHAPGAGPRAPKPAYCALAGIGRPSDRGVKGWPECTE